MESIRRRAIKIYIRHFKRSYFSGIQYNSLGFIVVFPFFIVFLIIIFLNFLSGIIWVRLTGKIHDDFGNIDYDAFAVEELSHGFPHVKSNLYHRNCNKKHFK